MRSYPQGILFKKKIQLINYLHQKNVSFNESPFNNELNINLSASEYAPSHHKLIVFELLQSKNFRSLLRSCQN